MAKRPIKFGQVYMSRAMQKAHREWHQRRVVEMAQQGQGLLDDIEAAEARNNVEAKKPDKPSSQT